MISAAVPADAQVTPAQGYTPPDDTPVIRVGATLFGDYTITTQPKVTDADGNVVTGSAFNVGRAYINITGNISHRIAFRITPDISRETGTGSSLNGSLTYRLKYGYGQFNLDDWMTRGSWVRFGVQQTTWVDFMETLYRYRFQGTIFEDREGFLSSSDFGVSFHYNFKTNYGDLHAGLYNGDTYTRPEANDQKAFMVRATVRPLPTGAPVWRGFRVTGYYDADHYLKKGDRTRGIFGAHFEHPNVNTSFNYLWASDQSRLINPKLDSDGFSFWVNPKTARGWEGLLRLDHLNRETSATVKGTTDRTLAGVSYWFPHQGTVSTVLLLDFERVKNKDYTPVRPNEQRWALHMLVNF